MSAFDSRRFTSLVLDAITMRDFDRHNDLMVAAEEFLAYFTPEPGDARIDLARRMAFAAMAFAFHETEDARLGLKVASQMFFEVGRIR